MIFQLNKGYIVALINKHQVKFKFLVAGAFNTLIGLGIYPVFYILLEPFALHYLEILIITYIVSISIAFLTNKYFVFQTKGNSFKELSKFFSFHGIQLAINLAMLPIIVEYGGITPLIAQPIFAIFVVLSSYFWHSRITFYKKD